MLKALKGKVLVTDIERGERMVGGIVIPNDDGKSSGIRPRWAKVYSVGEDITEIQPGEWIMVLHGRWSREMVVEQDNGTKLKVWGVDWPDAVILVSNEKPDDGTFSDKV